MGGRGEGRREGRRANDVSMKLALLFLVLLMTYSNLNCIVLHY